MGCGGTCHYCRRANCICPLEGKFKEEQVLPTIDTPEGWVSDQETTIDREELRQLRLDAYSWRAQQESYKRHGGENGICPYCGGPTAHLCNRDRPVNPILPGGVTYVGLFVR